MGTHRNEAFESHALRGRRAAVEGLSWKMRSCLSISAGLQRPDHDHACSYGCPARVNWSVSPRWPATSSMPRRNVHFCIREVTASSWLGLPHQANSYGTEARLGVLELAFGHLGAEAALTQVLQDNHASQRVSRKLGYEGDGISRDARGDEAVVSDRLRLPRDRWMRLVRPPIRVDGVAGCRRMFADRRRP